MGIEVGFYIKGMQKFAKDELFKARCEKADMAMRSRLNPKEVNMDRDSTKRIYV